MADRVQGRAGGGEAARGGKWFFLNDLSLGGALHTRRSEE